MICAFKEVGGGAMVCNTPDPIALFRNHCGCEPAIMPIGDASENLCVLIRSECGDWADVNLEVEGTLLHGFVVFVGNSEEGLMGLSARQCEYLKRFTLVESLQEGDT